MWGECTPSPLAFASYPLNTSNNLLPPFLSFSFPDNLIPLSFSSPSLSVSSLYFSLSPFPDKLSPLLCQYRPLTLTSSSAAVSAPGTSGELLCQWQSPGKPAEPSEAAAASVAGPPAGPPGATALWVVPLAAGKAPRICFIKARALRRWQNPTETLCQ